MLGALRARSAPSFASQRRQTTIRPTKALAQRRGYTAAAAFTAVTPTEVYKRLKTGEHAIFLDVRSEEMYNCYRVYNAVSQPASTFQVEKIADIPKDRTVYIYGEGPSTHPDVLKVANGVKSLGVEEVVTVNGGIDTFKDAGFFYWMDPDAENARLARVKAEEEAKKAAAAAKK